MPNGGGASEYSVLSDTEGNHHSEPVKFYSQPEDEESRAFPTRHSDHSITLSDDDSEKENHERRRHQEAEEEEEGEDSDEENVSDAESPSNEQKRDSSHTLNVSASSEHSFEQTLQEHRQQ
jgi:hypothetical protein